jgi:2-polyprenyl-3-methyl-5-hydroxy-6-metoxy-1,4-benzoquinol methylase
MLQLLSSASQAAGSRACDLCSKAEFETIAKFDRDGNPLETVICTTCGLISHADVPSDEQLDAFYARQYREQYHGEVTPSERRIVRAWRNGGRILEQFRPFLRSGARICEVGAGIGCTVKQFDLAGFDARGIEPHEGFLRFARDRLRARVEHAKLQDMPPDCSFDAILLVHVIEHFGSPRDALRRMHGMLVRDGLLYIECPNVGAPFSVRHRLFHRAHTYNFTLSSLAMLARSCGFELQRCFGDRRDGNLQVVFRKGEPRQVVIDPINRAETLAALAAATPLKQYFRPEYISSRALKISGYIHERLTARTQLLQIMRQCGETSLPAGAPGACRRAG